MSLQDGVGLRELAERQPGIWKILILGEWVEPTAMDDLVGGIRSVAWLRTDPWLPASRRELLFHWARIASRLLEMAVADGVPIIPKP